MNRERTAREATTALALAAVAGFVDAVGFITLRGLFTAHMTGNAVQFGVALGQGEVAGALPLIVALVLFVAAIAVGALIQELGERAGWRSTLSLTLVLEAALVGAFMLYCSARLGASGRAARYSVADFYIPAALAIGALGLQASCFSQVGGRGVRTSYISGVLTNLGQESVAAVLRPRDPDSPGLGRVALLAGIPALYLMAAVAGTLTRTQLQVWCLGIPILALAALAALDRRRPADRPGKPSDSAGLGASGRGSRVLTRTSERVEAADGGDSVGSVGRAPARVGHRHGVRAPRGRDQRRDGGTADQDGSRSVHPRSP